MIWQSMLWLAATAALLALAARALEDVLRSYGRATRWVWVSALCGSAVLPLAAWATDGAFPGGLLGAASTSSDLSALFATVDVSAPSSTLTAADASGGVRADRALAVVWFGASLLALALYALTWLRLSRIRRTWPAGRIEGTPVFLSPRSGPAVLGLIRPAIVVPAWLRSEPAAAQRMVLLHEREHVHAGDHVLLTVAPLLAVVMPWNLALWWQLRRLRLAIEVDCDRRVLAHGVEPAAYGTLLLDIARRGGPALMGAAALAEPRTFLERRILAMSSTIPRLRLARALALTAIAGVLALVACETATPTDLNAPAPQASEADVAAAVVEQPIFIEKRAGAPLYIVDGVIVNEIVVRALDRDAIDNVKVIKGAVAQQLYGRGAGGVIQIQTKEFAAQRKDRVKLEQDAVAKVRIREQPLLRVKLEPTGETRDKVSAEDLERAKLERALVVEKAREEVGVLRKRSPLREIQPAPVFEIDGVTASQAQLERLAPESIERIEVLKGAAAAALGITDGRGLIRITTKK